VSYLSQNSRTLHFGLGAIARIDRLEVRWLGGDTNVFHNLDADATWEITEGNTEPKRIRAAATSGRFSESRAAHPPTPGGPIAAVPPSAPSNPPDHRSRLAAFWKAHRAAMHALKVEKDPAKAVPSFQRALDLDPRHEDARYYLAQSLAALGDPEAALRHLEELTRFNPQSHRGWQQWGRLRAIFSRGRADLEAAKQALERAHALNPEETGALLVLGEVALLLSQPGIAEQHFQAACSTNPKAVGGFFLRGYLAWKDGDRAAAENLLLKARAALGPDWQPRGATSEGDVKEKLHSERSPLSRFWEEWDGAADPLSTFQPLEHFLTNAQ
jgi:tetratricopeptide (TPR) repeat protein